MSTSPSITDQIRRLASSREIIRPRDIIGPRNPSPAFRVLVDRGVLIKVGPGLYTLAQREPSARFTFAQASSRIPSGVICLVSALEFHEFTTQIGYQVWIALGDKRRLQTNGSVRIVRMSGASYTEGIETHDNNGMSLRVYNPAKTVADCFKFRRLVGIDVAMEALREGWRMRKFTVDQLMHYARINRVHKLMHPYVEMVVA